MRKIRSSKYQVIFLERADMIPNKSRPCTPEDNEQLVFGVKMPIRIKVSLGQIFHLERMTVGNRRFLKRVFHTHRFFYCLYIFLPTNAADSKILCQNTVII